MKYLYSYLSSVNITVKEFEDRACVILDNNDGFIPFATNDIMQHYSLSQDCEIEVSLLLAQILERYYTFAKRN